MQPILDIQEISAFSEEALCSTLNSRPHFFYLDSSDKRSKWGNFSFIGFNPFLTFKTEKGKTTITSQNHQTTSKDDPFELLDKLVSTYQTDINLDLTPFWGGAVGYIAYEAARYIKTIPAPFKTSILPDIRFGFYNNIIVINKTTQRKWLIQSRFPDQLDTPIKSISQYLNECSASKKQFRARTPETTVSKERYIDKIKKAKKHIFEGDIYEVNLTQQFYANYSGDCFQLYQQLRKTSPVPFGAYFNFPETQIMSASMERYIQIKKRHIQTRPIKGTIRRGATENEDRTNGMRLLHSNKNKAELMMIVDLLRNDLGTICDYGTVKVPTLLELETYAQVFHLVSTIEGQLRPEISMVQAFKAGFPGGSITGAPKIRSMQIIEDLELLPRSIYTGSIGYFGFNQTADSNIAIRTIYTKDNTLRFHAGGAIVADSDPETEYDEVFAKTKGIIDTLNQMNNEPIPVYSC